MPHPAHLFSETDEPEGFIPKSAVINIQQPEWAKRIEQKLDRLIEALAGEDEEEPVRSLDNGRTFAPRDDRKGLG